MSPSHIVLEDTQVFAELCGANDYNLSLIGSLLGTHVLTRGNELFVESDDPGVLSLFSRLISAIGTSIEEGVPATPE
ncbi:MAG TPA: PhoH family protein, partial [Rectinema sp.]|nr:PhoH family protein [Rectinema sp.]